MADRPNILFLLNDHQAHYRHGWDGGARPLRPAFDRLAAGGVRFDRAYTCCPLCTPARRSLLTGVYPHRHGLIDNREDRRPADLPTYIGRLGDLGYRTYYYGKWHAGPGTAADLGCEGFSLPGYGNPYASAAYGDYLQRRGLPGAEHVIERNFWRHWENMPWEPGDRIRLERPAWSNEHMTGLTVTPKETHESFFVAHLAREALQRHARNDPRRPFAMRVDFWGPHQPHFPTEEFARLYRPEDIPEYGNFQDGLEDKPGLYKREINWPLFDAQGDLVRPSGLSWDEWAKVIARAYAHISMVDAAGGLLLDTLDELGLAENTLVVWTTDHGDALACHGGHFDKSSFLSEELIRVPMAMRWPGGIPAGAVSEGLVSLLDVPVTLLDAAGTGFDNAVDGRSLLPVANGDDPGRDALAVQSFGNWLPAWGRALVTADHKAVITQDDIPEAYDLAADPYELRNLAAGGRDGGVGHLFERMERELDCLGDPMASAVGSEGGR